MGELKVSKIIPEKMAEIKIEKSIEEVNGINSRR